MCLFYNLNVDKSAESLYDLIPPSAGKIKNCKLRNLRNISETISRLSISPICFFH